MPQTYYCRNIDNELIEWSKDQNRKTLLIRGARQVGKSSAVRQLGQSFKHYIEVNFDDQEQLHSLFEQSLSPQEICEQLSVFYRTPIVSGRDPLIFRRNPKLHGSHEQTSLFLRKIS